MGKIKQRIAVAVLYGMTGFATACGGGGSAKGTPTPPSSPTPPELVNNSPFYVAPDSEAAQQAVTWQTSDPQDAERMRVIAAHPQAAWFGSWNTDVASAVDALVAAAYAAGKIPVLTAYNIPHLDCTATGGAADADAYKKWIQAFAQGIGDRPALVVLEPDALAASSCLSSGGRTARIALIAFAVATLKALPKAEVYVDAGNAGWISAQTMAGILKQADIADADGFSLNVANFYTTAASEKYGDALSALVGGKHFVIDTGRNGNGAQADGATCNPPGRALGTFPTATSTGDALADALLWIKRPGESDGTCNGGPAAGTWWPQYAAELAKNAGY